MYSEILYTAVDLDNRVYQSNYYRKLQSIFITPEKPSGASSV